MAESTDFHSSSSPCSESDEQIAHRTRRSSGARRALVQTPFISPQPCLLEAERPIMACAPGGVMASYDPNWASISLYSSPGAVPRLVRMPAQLAATTAMTIISRCLLIGHEDGAISLTDVFSRSAKVLVRDPNKAAITTIAATPMGELIAAGSASGRLFLWSHSRLLTTFMKAWSGPLIEAIAMSTGDDTLIGIAFAGNFVHIVHPANPRTPLASFGVKSSVRFLAISPDNRLAAVVLADGDVIIHDLRFNRPALFASTAQMSVMGIYFDEACLPVLLLELDGQTVAHKLECALPIAVSPKRA
ncbi:MAG: WD40 repeat domain-containing protein [Bradymonadaceae bacterium]|nr:WD40 repeat domain-containing protein [Lujinxingiaceae bacterium]